MCGIAGVFGSSNKTIVEQMVRVMHHRGPDDSGIWCSESLPAVLGHSRLAVIDTTPAGHQPMCDSSGRLWITHNGEIYNFRELKKELSNEGYVFRSDSDTEVILASYSKWGPSCVSRLRGMFAFAIVDLKPPAEWPDLTLARDRLGIKPLWYMEHKDALWFASEVLPFLNVPGVERKVDSESLIDFLTFGAVQQPRSMVSGVGALLPGHRLEMKNGLKRLIRYWDIHESTHDMRRKLRFLDETEASLRLRSLLTEASSCHMIADVPVGAFLSGGIDSSAVVALMRQYSPSRIKTFCVGFDPSQPRIEERKYARQASDYFSTEHTEVVVRSADMPSVFDKIVHSFDQPSIDGFNTWLVSEIARKDVTVAISGLGGDELFAGYDHFSLLANTARSAPQGHPKVHAFWFLARELGIRGQFSYDQLIRSSDPRDRYALVRSVVPLPVLRNIPSRLRTAIRNRLSSHDTFREEDADPIQQITYMETQRYLLNTLLRDGDNTSMAHSLELRPLLLDHQVVEFVYSLPSSLKTRQNINKPLLVNALRDILPPTTISRPKMGFCLPFRHWLQTDCRGIANDLLNSPQTRSIFSEKPVLSPNMFLSSDSSATYLWSLLVLVEWLRHNKIEV